MYDTLRQIHLYCGLVLLIFVTMYFATGAVMTHGEYFAKCGTTEARQERPITYTGEKTPAALGDWTKGSFHIAGRPTQVTQKPDGSYDLRYANAGSDTRVQIPAALDKATIITRTRNSIDMLHGLHRIHGYSGGWFYALWGAMYDLASLSMIVFGLTGICLWYRLTKKRALGWALVAISFAYPAAIICYLLMAR